ncbi:MAG: PQQ-binding-like beta-propeller repeat protein [bacterium]|nr:PQQ-binding-like beta-propeller repeat protein [bacterium]
MDPLFFAAGIIIPALMGLLYPYITASPQFLTWLVTALILDTLFFSILMKKFGGRSGQRILGLKVVDKQGNRPEMAATAARFAHLLIAGLFVFPLLGYLFIPFKKTKQGLHDRPAGTCVITKRAGLKALLSWFFILCLCGGIGWQAFMMMGGRFSYPLDPAAHSPEIALEARWTREFAREGQMPLTSFLNRGAQSIVSTAHSVYAVDMPAGEMLWQTDGLPELVLQALSSDTTLPLLGLQYDDDGETTLIRLDPANGSILWQQTLGGTSPRIHFDDHHIVALSDSRVSLYNHAGKQLWQRSFQDGFSPKSVAFHHGILLGRYAGEALHVSYLDRKNGELLWERKDGKLLPGYAIPDVEQQIFYTKEGTAMLLDLSTQELLWDSPQDLGYVLGHTFDRDSGQLYLHATTGMLRLQDGGLHVPYPAGFRLVGASNEYLILLQGSGGRQNTCLLLDKSSGATVQQIHERLWFAIFFLSEDKNAIYLAANSKSAKSGDNNIYTNLVRLDKKSWELKEIPIGRNIGMIRFKVFPQEGLLFIPLYQRIGGYLLPEM